MTQVQQATHPFGELAQRYQLLRRVGDDGFATTWEGLDTRLDRAVVLRVLSAGARHNEDARARLRREAREPVLTGNAEDVYAPRILDAGEDATFGPFLVAELNESFESTQPIAVTAEPPVATIAAPVAKGQPRGLIVLIAFILISAAVAVFLVRLLGSSSSDVAPAPEAATAVVVTRPLSGTPPGQPRAEATPGPKLAEPTTGAQPLAQSEATPQAKPSATAAAVAESATVGAPVATIREHYALIDGKRFDDGYELMSSQLRSLNSRADYASWFTNKVSIRALSVDLVSETGDQAVVRSVVATTDRVNGVETAATVSEEFNLRRERGAWRIDRVRRL